ncbi:MAG: hypothetical protein KAH23_06165 [Kiritimatiellae bacterium]|nr:hypothetical protein [Kiritimatiellia bacterium]
MIDRRKEIEIVFGLLNRHRVVGIIDVSRCKNTQAATVEDYGVPRECQRYWDEISGETNKLCLL